VVRPIYSISVPSGLVVCQWPVGSRRTV
jgi:hypothetical protein